MYSSRVISGCPLGSTARVLRFEHLRDVLLDERVLVLLDLDAKMLGHLAAHVAPRSGPRAPRARRFALIAACIWATSSSSFCTSTSGERVGFQSTCAAPEPG